jgi:signal transduction histidine kinase
MDRMSALIEQLLNLENMEAGEDLTLAPLDLRQLIETTITEFRYAASDKEPRLHFEGHPATAPILGDELWLNRAVANLVGNALKYTAANGRIVVRYRETEGMAVCEVSDNGPGIPAAAQARLFERFYRVRNTSTRSTPGTGLGLAIVKAIIEKHAGRVWVSSQEGQGSTFGFLIPLHK